MNNPSNNNRSYCCNICNKLYSSYKSLWNHNKQFHNENNNNVIQSNPTVIQSNPTVIQSNPRCKYCNKEYSNRQNKWKHEQKCKNNIKDNQDKELEIEKIKLEVKKEEAKIKKEEARILQLKLKLEKSTKIDNITLRKLNKLLLERSTRIKNSTVNSHNNIQTNNIVNNNTFQLVGFGKEEIVEMLTCKEKKLILNAKYRCLEKLVEVIHCGKYNQFKNIIITNMKDNYLYKYDDEMNQFVVSTKSDVLSSLVDNRVYDLEVIYNELLETNKLDEKTKDIIEAFINKINYSDDKFNDGEGKEYQTYKHYKINEIKVLLYNNQDKITNDISLLLTTTMVEDKIKLLTNA